MNFKTPSEYMKLPENLTGATAFNLEAFKSQTSKEAGITEYKKIPIGDHLEAYIAEGGVRGRDKLTRTGSALMELWWEVRSEKIMKSMGVDKYPQVKQTVFINITDQGSIDWSDNPRLSRIRAALRQNDAGKTWSPSMLEGAGPALIHVEWVSADDGEVYANVTRVSSRD